MSRIRHYHGVLYVARGNAAPPSFGDPATCGSCGRTWDDSVATTLTPAPSGRCPFEYMHKAPRDDKPAVRVLFRIGRGAEARYGVTAVFDEPDFATAPGNDFVCYAHIGQHSEGSLAWYHTTRRAQAAEYADLLAELRQVYSDCRLIVGQRRTVRQ